MLCQLERQACNKRATQELRSTPVSAQRNLSFKETGPQRVELNKESGILLGSLQERNINLCHLERCRHGPLSTSGFRVVSIATR
jgi:hypothetical protein